MKRKLAILVAALAMVISPVVFAETTINQTKTGNIFVTGKENPCFVIKSDNAILKYVVKDYFDETVKEGHFSIDEQYMLEFDDMPYGYFELILCENSSDSREVGKTSFCVVSDFDIKQVKNADFGMNVHLLRDGWNVDFLHNIALMGAKSIREDYEWKYVELQKGVFTFNDSGRTKLFEDYGFERNFASGFENPLYSGGCVPYDISGYIAFGNYLTGVLDMISPTAEVDVFNEFDGGFGKRGGGPANSQPSYYYELLRQSYAVLKEQHPEVKVLCNVTATGTWYETVMKLTGGYYMDGGFYHPYYGPINNPEMRIKNDMDKFDSIHAAYAKRKAPEIYATETGSSTYSNGISERKQAQFVPRAFALLKSRGVKKVYWYDYMDDGTNADEVEHHYGFIRNQYSSMGVYAPKPSYAAYAVMARQLSDYNFSKMQGTASVYDAVFEKDGHIKHVIWALEDTEYKLECDAPVTVTNIMGNSTTVFPLNGTVTVNASEDVLYLYEN